MGSIQNPDLTVDLSHHLNSSARARKQSPLKELIKYMQVDGMIGLAGGLPHASLFPFQKATFEVYPYDIEIDAAQTLQRGNLDKLSFSKEEQDGQLISLDKAMQYGNGAGDPNFLSWAAKFTNEILQPAFDFDVIATCGSTEAWSKVVRLFCDPGDYILTEEYTFPSAQSVWTPMGCRAAPVAMDAGGLRADSLEKILSEWDLNHPGIARPHLLYIVPVGSNPTGSTSQGPRKKKIYDVCVKYDVIIAEDDPYYFLQYPEYSQTSSQTPSKQGSQEFLQSLAPSFLKYDYQGRVIRLETFSKTLGPGLRLGYIICNKFFREKLLQATQVEVQSPSGLSQATVLGLITQWGPKGYLQWLSNLRTQYQLRRDWMCTAFGEYFDVISAENTSVLGAEGLVAYSKSDAARTKPLFSFVPPTGGMFIWTRFYLTGSARFRELQADATIEDPEEVYVEELWKSLAKSLVLVAQGTRYIPWEGEENATTATRGGEKGIGHFRLAFSSTSREDMELAVERLAAVVERAWGFKA